MIVFFSKNDEKKTIPAGIRTIELPIHYLMHDEETIISYT